MNEKLKNGLDKLATGAKQITFAGVILGGFIVGASVLFKGWDKTLFDYGLKQSSINVSPASYKINYRSKKFGNIVFKKGYSDDAELIIGNTLNGYLDRSDKKGIILKDEHCDNTVDYITDFDGYHSRKYGKHNQRFLKADRLFSSLTSESELADLIKKADAEWKRKYGPLNSDPLDEYTSH